MYDVDDRDSVVELNDAPRPDVGAPFPHLVSDEHGLVLAYIVSEPDPNWDGTYVNVVGLDSDRKPIAIVRFQRPYARMFGPPNDEAFEGHPLAARGLSPYGVFEIHQSSWLRRLEQMNSVHRLHDRDQFLSNRRHFVFAFHDSTFECIAHGFSFEIARGSMRSVLPRMIELLERHPR